jgi:signal transduction histidine kinase
MRLSQGARRARQDAAAAKPAGLAPPFYRRLHVRIGAVALVVLVLMALALLLLSRSQQQRVNLEVTQRLNLGLARYVLDHQARPLLTAAGEPDRPLLQELAMYVMRANPAVEVYVLAPSGAIIGHAMDGPAVKSGAVDMAPVHALLRDPAFVELPVMGDDPSAPGQRNIFSVAAIGEPDAATLGYLYIVLRGKAAQGLADSSSRSSAMREATLAVTAASGVALLALLYSSLVLTRPLRRLTAQARAFRDGGPMLPPVAPDADEITSLESALTALQTRVAEQFKQMEDSDRMRRELVSNLSHDLQTPLTSIQGYAEHALLKNDTLTGSERRDALQLILRHCASLSKRIGDLFELSKLDAGRMTPRLEVFCLAELLQDIVDGYQLKARAGQVALTLDITARTAANVLADIALMERVFQNLIDNALRHTPRGGAVVISIATGPTELSVSITDTGTGIAKEHLAHVFERYYQAQDTVSAHGGNSAGLGLAIVKRILELHGSAIRVSSDLARGTRFDFRLQRVV